METRGARHWLGATEIWCPDQTAGCLGKPSHTFFALTVEGLHCAVQTGKYRPGQEAHLLEPPTLIAENLKPAVDLLLN